ncbi:MAG: proton-conducting transporter membrane subunit [Pseudomonadota bacterium]
MIAINISGLLLVINNFLILKFNTGISVVLANILDGYEIKLTVEPFAIIFALMVSILYSITNLYSFAYIKAQQRVSLDHDLNPRIHFFFMPLCILAALNLGYSANLLTMFIFYELITLSTYPLVIQSFTDHAKKSGKYYLWMLFGSSSFFLLVAIVYIDYKYGITNFKLGGIFNSNIDIKEFIFLLICFVFGLSKTAIFPLYEWLPRAMVAPIPVSALLHAVAVVKSGIFALIKIFMYFFGIDYLRRIHEISPISIDWLSLLACFTIIFAGIRACLEDNIKKILAYSTIAQLSYMILVLSLNYDSSNAMLLMLSHSIAKITLFFIAGIIFASLHIVNVSEMKGIIRILPAPVILFILASFSIIGLPISAGFITSSLLLNSIPHDTIIGSIAFSCIILSKLLACFYFFKIIFTMLEPNPEIIKLDYKPKHLTYISFATYSLSALFSYYF